MRRAISPLLRPLCTRALPRHTFIARSFATPLRFNSTATTSDDMSQPPAPPAPVESQAGNVPGQGPPKIRLYTLGTPNGYKASVTLEELRAAYPELAKTKLSYDVVVVDITKNEQKHPSFLKICPNGRIPAIVDENVSGGHNVWESASIQIWLVENYDPEYKLWFKDPIERSDALSWIFWAQGGLGPMQGQANHFYLYAPVKIPYGIKRYTDETSRLYSVIEDQLAKNKNDWLVGNKFSIVDINVYGWARSYAQIGIDITPFPNFGRWIKRMEERPAVQKGLVVPNPPRPPQEGKAEELKDWVKKAEDELASIKK